MASTTIFSEFYFCVHRFALTGLVFVGIVIFMKHEKNTNERLHNRLIIIDIECYNGGPVTSAAQAQWCHRTLLNWVTPSEDDLIILATDISTVTNLHSMWGSHRILVGRGKDGADLRLLEVLEEDVAGRFKEVSLVSGDHIFAEKISQLAGEGIPTTVYCHESSLSKRLAFAATTVITSPSHPTPPPMAPAVVSLRKVA